MEEEIIIKSDNFNVNNIIFEHIDNKRYIKNNNTNIKFAIWYTNI